MEYIKVEWLHELSDEPKLLYSELARDRSEVRKVEMFLDGTFGHSDGEKSVGSTRLSETMLPSDNEINENPKFTLESISKEQFEEVWTKATKN